MNDLSSQPLPEKCLSFHDFFPQGPHSPFSSFLSRTLPYPPLPSTPLISDETLPFSPVLSPPIISPRFPPLSPPTREPDERSERSAGSLRRRRVARDRRRRRCLQDRIPRRRGSCGSWDRDEAYTSNKLQL
eukprot:761074-Hanusia_phi.AAC.1